MDSIRVTGGKALQGQIPIAGAKNAALTLMPASLLSEEPITLKNVPRLSDIATSTILLQSLGVEIASLQGAKVQVLSCKNVTNYTAHYDIVRKMRASILVLGPLLARVGQAKVSLPGGCAIGGRPVNIHQSGLEALGAQMELKDGYIHAHVNGRLRGAVYELPFASVGATENLLMAATLAKGTTVLKNVAQEPEIIDLAKLLCAMGAHIEGAGTRQITIEGVENLHGATHEVVADRIELGTYMLAPVIAGGQVELLGGRRTLLESFCQKLHEAGVEITQTPAGLSVQSPNERVNAVDVATAPYPGFPTDLQAQMMALMCTANGVAHLHETVFENRFMHAPELIRMGADIEINGDHATVRGVKRLKGAPVMATDLRASVSLLLAGLAAKGDTTVARVYHLDRGYENLEQKLRNVGADIERITT